MLKQLYPLLILLFSSVYCLGQKQITHFTNPRNNGSENVSYQSKINGKILFLAFTPETGDELWVSEGTKESTKLLKDIEPGSRRSSFYDFNEYKGNLYFLTGQNQLWKTDGTPEGTRMLFRSDSTMNLNLVNNRILISFRDIAHGYGNASFAWLTDSGQKEFWEESAYTFKAFDNKFYYTPYDSARLEWSLKVFDTAPRLIHQKRGALPSEIKVELYKGYEYLSVRENSQESLIVANSGNRDDIAKFYNWGPGPAPACLRDSSSNLFLVNDGSYAGKSTLQVYKVLSGNSWEKLADMATSNIYRDSPTGSNEGPMHTSFSIQGNRLFFTTIYGFESVYSSYLGVFDFKNNTKTLSAKLPGAVTQRESKIRLKSSDIFEITSFGTKCTYDLKTNTSISLETVPKTNLHVQLGSKTYEFSDNTYLLAATGKTPLMATREVYNERTLTYRDTLSGRLLFWTYSQEDDQSKLWSSDGDVTKEIFTYDGNSGFYEVSSKIMRVKNGLVFASVSQNGMKFFFTDGTTAGSRELYTLASAEYPDVMQAYSNQLQAAFMLRTGDTAERMLIVTDADQTHAIKLSPQANTQNSEYKVLVGTNALYVSLDYYDGQKSHQLLYRVKNGSLERVLDDSAGDFKVYQQNIYFSQRRADGTLNDIFYLDTYGRKRQIFSGPLAASVFKGNFLLVYQNNDIDYSQTVQVLKPLTGKKLGQYGRFSDAVLSGSYLAIPASQKLIVFHGEEKEEYDFSDDALIANPTPKGFYINGVNYDNGQQTTQSNYFYHKREGKMVTLAEKDSFQLNNQLIAGKLFFSRWGTNRIGSFIYDTDTQQRLPIPADMRFVGSLNGPLISVAWENEYYKSFIYAVEGNNLVEKYAVNDYSEPILAGNSNYMPQYLAATGNEISRLEKDSVHHFAEVIKGPEGVALHEIFHFKNGVYAVGFAFSKGLQVWKLGEVSEDPKPAEEDEEPVTVGPGFPGRVTILPENLQLNAYPNPANHELNVDLKTPGTIQIVDSKGFEILKTAAEKASKIDMKNLPAGQYFLIYTNEGGRFYKKIMKL